MKKQLSKGDELAKEYHESKDQGWRIDRYGITVKEAARAMETLGNVGLSVRENETLLKKKLKEVAQCQKSNYKELPEIDPNRVRWIQPH